MFLVVCVCPLRAIEEVLLLILFGFGVGAVGVWVGDLGFGAEAAGIEGVPCCEEGGEGGDAEDVTREDSGGLVR